MKEALTIVVIILLIILFTKRSDLLPDALKPKANKKEDSNGGNQNQSTGTGAPQEAPAAQQPASERMSHGGSAYSTYGSHNNSSSNFTIPRTFVQTFERAQGSPEDPDSVKNQMEGLRRDLKNGEMEIEDRALLEMAEYHGFADGDTTFTGVAESSFCPDMPSNDVGMNAVGPQPQDYSQTIKRMGLEPAILEGHAAYVEDQKKFSNAYATTTSGRLHAVADFPEPVPWVGLRRPQAVPIYGVMSSVHDTPTARVKSNKKFVFNY